MRMAEGCSSGERHCPSERGRFFGGEDGCVHHVEMWEAADSVVVAVVVVVLVLVLFNGQVE